MFTRMNAMKATVAWREFKSSVFPGEPGMADKCSMPMTGFSMGQIVFISEWAQRRHFPKKERLDLAPRESGKHIRHRLFLRIRKVGEGLP